MEVLAGDLEVQHAWARLLRRLLDLYDPALAPAAPARLTAAAVRRFLHGLSLPVDSVRLSEEHVRDAGGCLAPAGRDTPGAALRRVHRIQCYTDGLEEQPTRERLAAILRRAFPTGRFLVVFGTACEFPAAQEAAWSIGLE